MAAGEVDGVEVGGVDLLGALGGREEIHLRGVGAPGLGGLVVVGELQRPRLERSGAAHRADQGLLEARLIEHVPGVCELGQPQPSGMGRVVVVSDVGDDVEARLVIG
ncbi:hypothetical protein GCM10027089_04180 [Nocardia thraciensis]